MNDSQKSCSSLFDCSCPELDTLVSLSIQVGAFGSQLTGTGWGGCTISLVAEDKVEEFIEKVSKMYLKVWAAKRQIRGQIYKTLSRSWVINISEYVKVYVVSIAIID